MLKCLFVLLTSLLVNGAALHGSGQQLFYPYGQENYVVIQPRDGGGEQRIHYRCQGNRAIQF